MLKIPPIPQEPSYGLQEFPKNGEWVQRISVIRDGEKVWFQKIIGPASDFERVQPLMMPSFGDDTVAELQYWGEKNRNDTYWADRSAQLLGESTLITDHINQLEQMTLVRKNKSVLGPHQSTQRIEFPREQVSREFKEKYAN